MGDRIEQSGHAETRRHRMNGSTRNSFDQWRSTRTHAQKRGSCAAGRDLELLYASMAVREMAAGQQTWWSRWGPIREKRGWAWPDGELACSWRAKPS